MLRGSRVLEGADTRKSHQVLIWERVDERGDEDRVLKMRVFTVINDIMT